jgi:hypothetical protein
MTQTINQEAPAPEVKSQQNFFRFEPVPKSDTYVATLVGTNYLAECQFNRTDDKTGAKSVETAAGIEFFFGLEVDGKIYFSKSWPKKYSIHEKAAYSQWVKALTGKAPTAKDRPVNAVGGHALVEIEVADKVSSKGTKYQAVNIKSVKPVPSVLAGAKVPLDRLKGPFEAALKASEQKANSKGADSDGPF